ncbi:MAG: hypothetical protein FWC95_06490 [Defluviitaleaceae bacterium]|nr:hypothetical protein [Defluviitaleaceae bacterium]
MAKIPLGDNWKRYSEEISASIQKKERPKIDKIIDLLLTDPILNAWLTKIVAILKENNERPTWYGTSKYRFQHKKETSFYITVGNGFKFRENEIFITMNMPPPASIALFETYLTDEMRVLLLRNVAFIECRSGNLCSRRLSFDFLGSRYESVCTMKFINFSINANIADLSVQLRIIEDFVKAKIRFSNAIRNI